jgi:hypothetical protein
VTIYINSNILLLFSIKLSVLSRFSLPERDFKDYLDLRRDIIPTLDKTLIKFEKPTLLKRETAKLTQPLYSSGLRLTSASIKLTAAVATPYKKNLFST